MLKPPDTVSIAFVHGMLSAIRGEGKPGPDGRLDDWLADAGIAPRLLDEPHARVTLEQYVALFDILMARLDDEFLGFLSRPMRRGTLALLLRSTLGAENLRHALRRLVRTFRLLQEDVQFRLVEEGGVAGLAIDFRDGAKSRLPFLHELLLRVFWRVIAWLHGGRLKPSRFDFAFAAPAHAPEYAKVFPGAVRFDAPITAVWFDARSLSTTLLCDEVAMRSFLDQAPGIVVIPQRSDHATSTRVRAVLQMMRPAWPDLATTAQALHLSTSTLQRHLAAEGVSFQALKDQLRRDVAIVRLNTTTIPLATLAAELGFADSPAFQRAFKSWTGSAAGAYRRSLQTTPSS